MEQASVSVRVNEPGSGLSRAQLLRRGGTAGALICVGGVSIAGLVSGARSAGGEGNDEDILRFALQLEHLQAAFYGQAATATGLDDDVRAFASAAAGHEQEHIAVLSALLGDAAEGPPTFDFGEATTNQPAFLRAAVVLEDLGVDAYNGQAANLSTTALVQTARIVSVDARHAAWVRSLAGDVPAPEPVNPGRRSKAVMADVNRLGFIQGIG